MKDKLLPIKFFQKRKDDQLDTEGMSNKELPKWAKDSSDKIGDTSVGLNKVFSSAAEILKVKQENENFIPVVMRIQLNDDARAKSPRRNLNELFKSQKSNNIIGMDEDGGLLVKVEDEKDTIEINEKVSNLDKFNLALAAIDDEEIFKAKIDFNPEEESLKKVKLLDYDNFHLNEAAERYFTTECEKLGLSVEKLDQFKKQIVFSVSGVTLDNLDEFINIDGIYCIEEFPSLSIDFSDTEPIDENLLHEPLAGGEYEVVGVLDTGVYRSGVLEKWLIEDSYTAYVPEEIDKRHGTAVASILVYGDILEGINYTGTKGIKIFEAIVFPNHPIDTQELLDNIRDAISLKPDIKIWNMCLGTKEEVYDSRFSDFAIELDSLQDEFNVLIITTTGNCNNYRRNKAPSKIAKSADSLRSIVVGSLAHKKNASDYSEVNYPSPFTRIGPAPGEVVKPDLVHYGGNAGMNAGRPVETGVNLIVGDKMSSKSGTSFSAPRISSLAAYLNNSLDEKFDPRLIKSLLIHHSNYPTGNTMRMKDKLNSMGFGVPTQLENILFNNEDEITLILQDTLERGKFINIMEFPFPEGLVNDDGYFYGEICVTLCYDPILGSSEGIEYCQSNIDVSLGTYEKTKKRDTTKSHIKNSKGLDGNKNILSDHLYSKKVRKNEKNKFNSERILIKQYQKYKPIKKWHVSLDEMTETNRLKYLEYDRKWYLKINGLYRLAAESKAIADEENLAQDFTLIITIRDPKERGITYTQVTQSLNQFNFIHSNVRLKENNVVNINTKD